MNYVQELRNFYIRIVENPLNSTEQALWNRLMAYDNSFAWKDKFKIANSRLMMDLSISKTSLVRARESLIKEGFIEYESGYQGHAGVYKMVPINIEYSEESGTINKTKQNNTKEIETKQEKTTEKPKEKDVDCFSLLIEDNKLRNVLYDFAQMREKMGKPLTDSGKEMLINKLDDLSKNVNDKIGYKIKVLENSIINSWQSVFPLKDFHDRSDYVLYDEMVMEELGITESGPTLIQQILENKESARKVREA